MKRRKVGRPRTIYRWENMTATERRNQRVYEMLKDGYTLDETASAFNISKQLCREAFYRHLGRWHRERARSYNLRDDWDKMVYMKKGWIECDAAIVEYETKRSYTDGEKGLW